jgi:hypothetical protein
MTPPFPIMWAKTIRHALPIGRDRSHGAGGGFCHGPILLPSADGIVIAQVRADQKAEEDPYDDF